MNEIQIFKNEKFGAIRVAGTSEEPLFCLADVCRALSINNVSQCKTRLKQDEVVMIDLNTLTKDDELKINIIGNSTANFITESNLYRCIFMSRKKEAEQFQDWVTSSVLPEIRKAGYYNIFDKIEKLISNYNKQTIAIYTYILTDGSGLFKIGRTTNVDNRMRQYATHNPTFRLIAFFEGDIEKYLHQKYEIYQYSTEWFNLSNFQINEIISTFNFNRL